MTPCDYGALREAAGRLSRLGLSLQTVIPVALPAIERFSVTRTGILYLLLSARTRVSGWPMVSRD